jgi:hypothetical protein
MINKAKNIHLTASEHKKALAALKRFMKEYMPPPLPRSSPISVRRGSKNPKRKPISEY